MNRFFLFVTILATILTSLPAQTRPSDEWWYPEDAWHGGMKDQMLERIARFETSAEMKDRFTPQEFARIREFANGIRLDPEAPSFATDMALLKRMRNSSLFLLDAYLILIRDGQIQSLTDATRLMNDERAATEIIKPILFSKVNLRWDECPNCYMRYFRTAQHSMFPEAHEAFVMITHKFGLDRLPTNTLSEYIQYVGDTNLLASKIPTVSHWMKNYDIQPVGAEDMVRRILMLKEGKNIVSEGLILSGSAEPNEGGLPRAIFFGSIPGTGFHQTESWDMMFSMLLAECRSAGEEVRMVSLVHSRITQALNRTLETNGSREESGYTSFMIPYPLDDTTRRELHERRVERTREILSLLEGRGPTQAEPHGEEGVDPSQP